MSLYVYAMTSDHQEQYDNLDHQDVYTTRVHRVVIMTSVSVFVIFFCFMYETIMYKTRSNFHTTTERKVISINRGQPRKAPD